MAKEQTSIAGEFWFFSQLQRLGYKAFITLGNTKSVDLALQLNDNRTLTFDVKSKMNFGGSFQYLNVRENETHYYVFVNLEIDKKNEKTHLGNPKCYIINSFNVKHLAFQWGEKQNDYGFEAKLLCFLKDRIENSITNNLKEKHKQRHHINGEIDFEKYRNIILSMEDFEENFYPYK